VVRREITWIKNYAVPKAPDDPLLVSTAQNSPGVHIQLLEKFLKVAPYLMDIDKQLTCSTLWHTDLHSSNIFVDRNRITAVIDWQGVWAGPLFLQAQPSQLVDYQGSILLKRPDNFDNLDDEHKIQIKQQISKSMLFQLYLLETEERNPTLSKVFHLDHGKTRRLPVEFAGNTWDDDIVSFREALINLERYT
jgi:Phosphotransferase enzyme family